MFLFSMMQCWRGSDRSLHHAQYRAGADALRGRGGHLPDGQNAKNPAASHGADRGERHWSRYKRPNQI